uniref:Uncharacterized protein n=1 Tax=Cucumis melo TaxID=3656 RepID=A0A9I9E5Y8_CUCME
MLGAHGQCPHRNFYFLLGSLLLAVGCPVSPGYYNSKIMVAGIVNAGVIVKCPRDDDLKYAKVVCDQVYSSRLTKVNFSNEYSNEIKDLLGKLNIIQDTHSFMYKLSGNRYDSILHYTANICCDPLGNIINKLYDLCITYLFKVKDQTYFLSHLSQNQLKRLLFPLGCIPKTSGCIPRSSSSTVDCDFSNIFLLSTLYSFNNHLQDEFCKLAVKFNLPNKDRKEPQGICFLEKYKTCQLVLKFSDGYTFPEQVFYFLILPDSQHQGLRLPGGPWYAFSVSFL